jgi:hypothetical protein
MPMGPAPPAPIPLVDLGEIVVDPQGIFVTSSPNALGTLLLVQPNNSDGKKVAGGTMDLDIGAPLAADDTNLYFGANTMAGAGLFSLPRAGGMPTLLASTAERASHIAVDARNVYWSTQTSIFSVSVNGGGPAKTVAIDPVHVDGMALDHDYIYWTYAGSKGGVGATVRRAPLLGGFPELVADQRAGAADIAIVGSILYWVDEGHSGVDCTPTDGQLISLTDSMGATPKVLVDSIPGAGAMAVTSDGSAYLGILGMWCGRPTSPGVVEKISLADGTTTIVADNQIAPGDVAVDATSVYWTAILDEVTGDTTIRKANR